MRKKIITITATALIFVMAFGLTAFAGAFARADRSKKSNLVVVGDSRIYYIFKSYDLGTDTSYSALIGGNYGWSSPNIISGDRESTIKTYVQNCIKKHGSCRLVIEGTTNEVAWGAKPWTKIQAFAKRASKWSAKYNGKTVKPKVYVTECLKRRSGTYNAETATYNSKNKAAAADNNYKYINLKNPEKSDYADDAHFTKAFSKTMLSDIKTKAK